MALTTVDSNVLIYAADDRDAKQPAARVILRRLARSGGILTQQALAEFFHASTRKKKLPPSDAATEVQRLIRIFGTPHIATQDCLTMAMEARVLGRFQFWDAMLLATAGAAGCTALITEDMHPGATLAGVTIVPAFAGNAISPEAASLLA